MRLRSAVASVYILLLLVGAPTTASAVIVATCTDLNGCDDVPAVTYLDSVLPGRDRYSVEWLGFTGNLTAASEAWSAGGTWAGIADPAHDFVQITFYFGPLDAASLNFPYSGTTSVSDQGNWAPAVAGAVPEPSTLALLSAALAAMTLLRRPEVGALSPELSRRSSVN